MKKVDSSLTKEQFDQLLNWLDPTLDGASAKYEAIRRRLILIFLNRGSAEAEDLADETINRVAKKLPSIKEDYVGDPATYFYGVAKYVFKEHLRKGKQQLQSPPSSPPPHDEHDEMEARLNCLDQCLAKLKPESRELILRYYDEQNQGKIPTHKEMSAELQLKAGALRARAHRIRVRLEKCVLECLEGAGESNDIGPTGIQGWNRFRRRGTKTR